MRIIKLKAENFKKLKAIEITPKEDVVVISGKNNAGKTSVLDAIWSALGGSKGIPKEPVKKGSKRKTAAVQVDLGEYIVTRTFTPDHNYLTIENKEGATFKSPQALLDQLIGDLTFNPLEFTTSKNRDEILLNLVGLKDKFEKIKSETDKIYMERTVLNRQIKQMEGQLEGYGSTYKDYMDGPKVIQPVQELTDQLQEARKKIDDKFHMETKLSETTREQDTAISKVEYLKKELKKTKEECETINKIRTQQITKLSQMEVPDIEGIEVEINNRIERNEKARGWQEFDKILSVYEKLKKESNTLTCKLGRQSGRKTEAIEKAEFPIKGLSYDDGIFYNDIPFEQVSDSEKLRVSMSIAMALNPKIRVIRITDGSLLDSENMKIIRKLAKDQDYQIWIEQVDETGKVGIYIEEGEVKAVNE